MTNTGEGVERGKPAALLVGMYAHTATMDNSTEVPQKTTIELKFDPAIPLLSIYPDKNII